MALVVCGFGSTAWAQVGGCKGSSRASVSVGFEGPGWSGSWASGVHRELTTEIDASGLCEAAPGDPADAQVVMRFDSNTVVEMEVSAGDSSARRSVRRKLDLEPLPVGQWAFAVGVSASELLREAREVIPVLRPPEPPEPDRPWTLSVRGHGLLSGAGVSLFGAGLSARRAVDRLVIELTALVSWFPTKNVGVGAVSGFAPGGDLMIGAVLIAGRAISLDAGAMLDVRWLSLNGVASSDTVVGQSAAALMITALGVSTVWVTKGNFVASLRLGLGGVARGASVRVSGTETSAYRGVAGLAELGVGARF